jgi:hypothetical protein
MSRTQPFINQGGDAGAACEEEQCSGCDDDELARRQLLKKLWDLQLVTRRDSVNFLEALVGRGPYTHCFKCIRQICGNPRSYSRRGSSCNGTAVLL